MKLWKLLKLARPFRLAKVQYCRRVGEVSQSSWCEPTNVPEWLLNMTPLQCQYTFGDSGQKEVFWNIVVMSAGSTPLAQWTARPLTPTYRAYTLKHCQTTFACFVSINRKTRLRKEDRGCGTRRVSLQHRIPRIPLCNLTISHHAYKFT